MVALSGLNASTSGLVVGDWIYSLYARSEPEYLPLNNSSAGYLAASYPTLFGLLPSVYKVFPASTTGTATTSFTSKPAYGNGLWVAVNTTSNYKTSTDGLTWTGRTGAVNAVAVAYGAGLFVAVGSGVAASSPDGITWTQRTSFPGALAGYYIVWSGSLFVAVGTTTGGAATTIIATSPDGINWTARTGPSALYNYLAYGNGMWVCLTGGTATGTYATSPDGINWTSRTGLHNFTDGGLAFGNGIFLSMMTNSTFYCVSTDGINWTARSFVGTLANSGLTFGDGIFVTCNENATAGMRYSTDGISWLGAATTIKPVLIAPSVSGNFFYSGNSGTVPYRQSLAVSTTLFTLPVITPLTNTLTYVKAT